jgi:tRNA A37 threonylcarbamoyladenosine synthetase subunit TsaC/SUA5/YrdC
VDAGGQSLEPTTVVDLTGAKPLVTRLGSGPVDGRVELATEDCRPARLVQGG